MTPRGSAAAALIAGLLAVAGATVIGTGGDWLGPIVTPPAIVRAALVGGFAALGVVLFTQSVRRLADAGTEDVAGLVRAVRRAFLAVAAFAAAAGWAIGHPLPIVVAAIIAGVDVLETSFLLLVVSSHDSSDEPGGRGSQPTD
ncbi:MAG: hypothetical protein OEV61_05750 [Chloroflexota bacterium]|jgi:hypothetical protein|nr:hypothetical protein [Chloroflexota bacterium]MDH5244477.1 hypothetical protein [Chloroflexota bacterium]